MFAWFKGASLLVQVLTVIGMLATVGGTLWKIHDSIWTDGYDTRVQEEKDEKAKHDQIARENILKTEKKYEKAEKKLKNAAGRDAPVSPLVGMAIDSLPISQ